MPHLASVAYIAATAIWTDRGVGARAWIVAALAILLAVAAAGLTSRLGRVVGWGLAVVMA